MLRTEVAFDLITRPWDTRRPPVTANLTIHAPLDALRPPVDGRSPQPPAEIDGEVVTAAECRALLTELDMLGVRQAPAGGCVRVAVGDPATGRADRRRHPPRTRPRRRHPPPTPHADRSGAGSPARRVEHR